MEQQPAEIPAKLLGCTHTRTQWPQSDVGPVGDVMTCDRSRPANAAGRRQTRLGVLDMLMPLMPHLLRAGVSHLLSPSQDLFSRRFMHVYARVRDGHVDVSAFCVIRPGSGFMSPQRRRKHPALDFPQETEAGQREQRVLQPARGPVLRRTSAASAKASRADSSPFSGTVDW